MASQVIYKVWGPRGAPPPERLPVALFKEGEVIASGVIKALDVLLLPKSQAEVAQVLEVVDSGQESEAFDLLPLPRQQVSAGAPPPIPWRLSLKALNGAPDSTGAHRPLGVIRLGQKAPEKSSTAVVLGPNGVEIIRINMIASQGLVQVGCPVNTPLRSLAKSLPVGP